MSPRRSQNRQLERGPGKAESRGSELRIIGGTFRNHRLRYTGRMDTRPMKDRVREATFNLVGPAIRGKHAIDLFAGTGAIGLEAISRGAAAATFVERHVPTTRVIRENIERLGVGDRCTVAAANALLWVRQARHLPTIPWVVFCSPPWDLLVAEQAGMLEMIGEMLRRGPEESILVVEADDRFDFSLLPDAARWKVRKYPPAVIGILHKSPAGILVREH